MKKISKKVKIIALLLAIIIIVGAIVTLTIGLNFNLRYQETKKIQLYLEKDFEISDIKKITDIVDEIVGSYTRNINIDTNKFLTYSY